MDALCAALGFREKQNVECDLEILNDRIRDPMGDISQEVTPRAVRTINF